MNRDCEKWMRKLAPVGVVILLFLLLPKVLDVAGRLPRQFAAGLAGGDAWEGLAAGYRGACFALLMLVAWFVALGLAFQWLRAELGVRSATGSERFRGTGRSG